ncbi:Na-translocating system protein MpsC family protein [Patulibacter sp.]|uniref:Na-translocating system protein MpsC family protein n=1 Tax=Patulibacter sp. TaxID=1912859 RepID=UPI00271DFF5F|nr:Na-translocating system protein MpsC family protein [Patulibacter sp.]MDO9409774.1 Na-translocating system protein MpsC family protein [Patulibacter sp.]
MRPAIAVGRGLPPAVARRPARPTMVSTDPLTAPHESPLQAISNAMAQIHKTQFGRGPTKVKTYFAGPDAVVCVLEDTQTPAEKRLVELGEHQRLRDVRLFFQYATEDDMRAPVEHATGRRVRAFISGIDVRADASVELFLLESTADAEPAG